jgi:hypothetical protein
MSLPCDTKAQIRIIESVFAAVLLLSCVAFIPSEVSRENSHVTSLYTTALHALTILDGDGSLSQIIENRSWVTLRKSVQSLLPSGLWFNLTVFDENMTCLNDVKVSCGGAVGEQTIAAEYICASTSSSYSIYVVRLELSRVN